MYMYEFFFFFVQSLKLKLPITKFECAVLRQVIASPTKLLACLRVRLAPLKSMLTTQTDIDHKTVMFGFTLPFIFKIDFSFKINYEEK